MSAPLEARSEEPGPRTEPAPSAPRRPESTGAVIGIGAALGVIALAVLAVVSVRPRPLDGPAWLAERLARTGAPDSTLEHAETLRLLDGQTWVLLRDPAAPAEPAADPVPKSMGPGGFGGHGGGAGGGGWAGGGAGDGGGPKVDWSTLEVAAAGGPPVEVAFSGTSKAATKKLLTQLFAQVRFRDIGEIGGGGDLPVAIGELDWHGYEASYVHTRHFEKVAGEPAFHDTVRVNLTTGERGLVLFARWPRGVAGSPAWVEEFLRSYAPVEREAA